MNLDQLISKFILGQSNSEEKEALENWKKESEENLSILKETIRVNELSDNLLGYKDVNTSKAWDKVAQRTVQPTKIISISRWAKIAAVVITVVMAVAIIKFNANPLPVSIVHTSNEASNLNLQDGSVINLDKHATLIENGTRAVTLKGRAYFDIAPDKNAPFIVETNHGTLTVLGTEFNIVTNDYSSQIYVTEGKVSHKYKGKEYILVPGDILQIDGDQVLKTSKPSTQITAWKLHKLKFTNESLRNVLESIAVYYNVSLVFQTQQMDDQCKINTTYNDETIEQILKELAIVAGLKYQYSNNNIIIKSFKC
ncbi:MAG: FecR family protein [Saprospiraceae bacterium]|nr:FecR family protein [Saprospiraceae bacterium]